MNISVIVNIILSVLSFALAVISIALVIITLRQNNKILEASNRPYITMYFESITTTKRVNYFVIKNFGNTSGTIKRFSYPAELKTSLQSHPLYNEQFDCIEGIALAPGQSKLFPYNVSILNEISHFEIVYISPFSDKEYTEIIDIDAKKMGHIPVERPGKPKTENCFHDSLITTLHEIAEKQI